MRRYEQHVRVIASYRPSLFAIYDIAGHILQSILVIDQTFNVLIGICVRE